MCKNGTSACWEVTTLLLSRKKILTQLHVTYLNTRKLKYLLYFSLEIIIIVIYPKTMEITEITVKKIKGMF